MSEKIEYSLTFVDDSHDFDDLDYVKNTLDDFGLRMTNLYIPKPKVKTNKVEIPFASGSIDMTDVTGITNYNDRDGLQFDFFLNDSDPEHWERIVQRLSMFLHGKKLKMKTDYAPDYYYVVRLGVDSKKSSKKHSTITLSGTSEPFKYALMPLGDDWRWDDFSFEDGVILHLSNLSITNGGKILISTDSHFTVPQFDVKTSNNLKLVYKGKTYSMPSAGRYYFPQVRIGYETLNLTFTGSGTFDIDYRGRYL